MSMQESDEPLPEEYNSDSTSFVLRRASTKHRASAKSMALATQGEAVSEVTFNDLLLSYSGSVFYYVTDFCGQLMRDADINFLALFILTTPVTYFWGTLAWPSQVRITLLKDLVR